MAKRNFSEIVKLSKSELVQMSISLMERVDTLLETEGKLREENIKRQIRIARLDSELAETQTQLRRQNKVIDVFTSSYFEDLESAVEVSSEKEDRKMAS